jgi:hypothetical protein
MTVRDKFFETLAILNLHDGSTVDYNGILVRHGTTFQLNHAPFGMLLIQPSDDVVISQDPRGQLTIRKV